MLFEPTTLASIVHILGDALTRDYGVDPVPIFAAADVDYREGYEPGGRIAHSRVRKIFDGAIAATGDPAIGLRAGWHAKPSDFYAFGHSWLASSTLVDALHRVCRYDKLICTSVAELELRRDGSNYVITESYPDVSRAPFREQIDAGLTSFLKMARIVADADVKPLRVAVTTGADAYPDAYRDALEAPVTFGHDATVVVFDRAVLEAPLAGAIPEVARATDRISEQYIESLDGQKVATQVRRMLVGLLPSGDADQDRVASDLNRSASKLQRQLQAEGVSYRQLLDDTRRSLAEEYLRERKHSHAQIAYLVGFSDQSNFSRAFKRWTGTSPRQFQERHRRDASQI